jgi:hypothetical protein
MSERIPRCADFKSICNQAKASFIFSNIFIYHETLALDWIIKFYISLAINITSSDQEISAGLLYFR